MFINAFIVFSYRNKRDIRRILKNISAATKMERKVSRVESFRTSLKNQKQKLLAQKQVKTKCLGFRQVPICYYTLYIYVLYILYAINVRRLAPPLDVFHLFVHIFRGHISCTFFVHIFRALISCTYFVHIFRAHISCTYFLHIFRAHISCTYFVHIFALRV